MRRRCLRVILTRMNILFFDDEEHRFDIFKHRISNNDKITYCKTLEDCHQKLVNHILGNEYFDVIHFDHDIQDFPTQTWHSSAPLAEWFVQNCPKDKSPKLAVIHSVNANGSWTLYHIFMRLTKTFMSPFRIEVSEYNLMF